MGKLFKKKPKAQASGPIVTPLDQASVDSIFRRKGRKPPADKLRGSLETILSDRLGG